MRATLAALVAVVLAGSVASACAAAEPTGTEAGRRVYVRNCVPCHARGSAGSVLLARRLGESKALLDERDDLAPAYVRHVVRHGLGGMPWLTPVELPETDLDALVAYLTRPASLKDPGAR